MAKFKINQEVESVKSGKRGYIKAREVNTVNNFTTVKYLVDFGEGIEKWKVVTKKEIKPVPKKAECDGVIYKVYKLANGMAITIAARVETFVSYAPSYNDDYDDCALIKTKNRVLTIGYSIYNGVDTYNEEIGKKYAKHRCIKDPFTTMYSSFGGEFNYDTVVAIMDAKAKYIADNIKQFLNSNIEA